MWHANPDQATIDIRERQSRLRAEAANERLAPREHGGRWYRIDGFRLQVGDLLIVVGRALCDDDERALRPAH